MRTARERRRAEETEAGLANSDKGHDEPPRIRRHIPKAEGSEKLSTLLPKLQVRGNTLAGVLVGIDCPKDGVFFVIKNGPRSYRFYAPEPEKVLLYDERQNLMETMEMACGRRPTPVIITFRSLDPPSPNSHGEVLGIQFAGPCIQMNLRWGGTGVQPAYGGAEMVLRWPMVTWSISVFYRFNPLQRLTFIHSKFR